MVNELNEQNPQESDGLELQLRSAEVQDILTFIPNWLIRWGISAVFLAILSVVACSWFIRYPEVITGRVVLHSDQPSARLVTKVSGTIRLLVKDGEQVSKGQYLAAIETTAVLSDVQELKAFLAEFAKNAFDPSVWAAMNVPKALNLGQRQKEYSAFVRALDDYQFAEKYPHYQEKAESFRKELESHRTLESKLETQRGILEKELASIQQEFAAHQSLFERKIIAQKQLAVIENKVLEKKHALVEEEKNIVKNHISSEELARSILEIEQKGREQKQELILAAQKAFDELSIGIEQWEAQYVLQAPVAGIVSFAQFVIDNQYAKEGEEVLAIVPGSGEVFGTIQLSESGAGKVRIGNKVHIRLDSYPDNEFGTLLGELTNLAQVASNNKYLLRVRLPEGMRSSYRKELAFKDGMQGDADIVADDLRLFERIFRHFRYLFSPR